MRPFFGIRRDVSIPGSHIPSLIKCSAVCAPTGRERCFSLWGRTRLSFFVYIVATLWLITASSPVWGKAAARVEASSSLPLSFSEANASRILTFRFFSASLCTETVYHAFLPGHATKDVRFPVVYLLHGAGGSQDDWYEHGRFQLAELAGALGLVIVLPSGGAYTWYADSMEESGSKVESFLLRELLPHVERHLPVNEKRALAGLSMGGHGALSLGLRHPRLFCSLSSMSGVLDLTRHPRQWGLADVFGPLQSRRPRWEAHSAAHLIASLAPADIPALLITTGREDSWVRADNHYFHAQLHRRGLAHVYRETRGGHDWTYWLGELPPHMAFHAAHLEHPAPAGTRPGRPAGKAVSGPAGSPVKPYAASLPNSGPVAPTPHPGARW